MRPDLSRIHPFFQTYTNHVETDDELAALTRYGQRLLKLMSSIPPEKYDYRYGPDKWTLKEVFQHIIDTERILCFRALSLARLEPKPLPGFEENDYVDASAASHRDWNDMIEEFSTLRSSSIFLFRSFTDEQMERAGLANGNPLYVRGLAFIVCGHAEHHAKIIENRYI